MQSRGWLMLGMLAFPALAPAQAVKEADLIGGWQAQLEHADGSGESGDMGEGGASRTRGSLLLWPDGLWWYGGGFMRHEHGGARWRLVGDTLWLGNDYIPYFHPMIGRRIEALQEKGYRDIGTMDMEIIRNRKPFPVPDSVYWLKTFRDTTSVCAEGRGECGTWVYKVSKKGQQFYLVRLDSLSRATESVATKAVLTRDSLVDCNYVGGCP